MCLTALIVEHDKRLRKIYGDYLIRKKYSVLEADKGSEALLNTINQKIDLILLNIGIGSEHGCALIDSLEHFHPEAEIVLMRLPGLTKSGLKKTIYYRKLLNTKELLG